MDTVAISRVCTLKPSKVIAGSARLPPLTHRLSRHGEHGERKRICVCLGNSYIRFFFFNYSDSLTLLSFVLILQKTNKTTMIKQKTTRFVAESWGHPTFPGQQVYMAKLTYKSNNFFRSQFFFLYFCTKLPIS